MIQPAGRPNTRLSTPGSGTGIGRMPHGWRGRMHCGSARRGRSIHGSSPAVAATPACNFFGHKKPPRIRGVSRDASLWLWVDSNHIMRARHLKYLKERYWTSMFIQKLH